MVHRALHEWHYSCSSCSHPFSHCFELCRHLSVLYTCQAHSCLRAFAHLLSSLPGITFAHIALFLATPLTFFKSFQQFLSQSHYFKLQITSSQFPHSNLPFVALFISPKHLPFSNISHNMFIFYVHYLLSVSPKYKFHKGGNICLFFFSTHKSQAIQQGNS